MNENKVRAFSSFFLYTMLGLSSSCIMTIWAGWGSLEKFLQFVVQSDFIQYWTAAKLIGLGQNPYDVSLQATIQYEIVPQSASFSPFWLSPLSTIIIYPLSFLGIQQAALVWTLMSLVVFGISLTIGSCLSERFRPSRSFHFCLGFLSGLSLPVIEFLRMGQISSWIALGVSLIILAVRSNSGLAFLSGIWLCSLKPHLFLLTFPALAYLFYQFSDIRRSILKSLCFLMLSLIVISLVTRVTIHNWFSSLASSGQEAVLNSPADFISSSFADFLSQLLQDEALSAKILLRTFLPFSMVIAWIWSLSEIRRIFSKARFIELSIVLSFIAAPYSWVFDFAALQVLVYPLLLEKIYSFSREKITYGVFMLSLFLSLALLPYEYHWYYQFWYYPFVCGFIFLYYGESGEGFKKENQ